MKFNKLVPNIFYTNINDGIELLVNCLGFTVTHEEFHAQTPFCVVEKDGLRINLFQDEALAKEHYPEFRLVTSDIEEVFAKISASHPALLHPNLPAITLRPWGAKEFALMDKQVGFIIQQWD
ncbi:MAG: hypothetical protein EOO05_14615 [Chitinophagaceae bacterium]|nr:MAG: hypothetical protein EOO05_14615 [Chitinophagaceae bacterium]